MIPYSIGVEQDGCLWFYEFSPRDGARVNIVQVPVHLLTGRGACFAEVRGLCIDPRFLPYWSQHGGLYQFGFPLAPAFVEREVDGKDDFVQSFERVRMEYHPENEPPYDILLGLLGDAVTADRRGEAPFQPRPRPAGCDAAAPVCASGSSAWFAATGHSLGETAGGAAGAVIANQWITKGG